VLPAGTYYLTLLDFMLPGGSGHLWWNENDGPSLAFQSGVGQLPGSESFEIGRTLVPEPRLTFLLSGLLTGILSFGVFRKFRATRV
jgi:hypothetical protein